MCDFCKEILIDFGIQHTKKSCPLRNSFYCSFCACYGHLTDDCNNKPSVKYTEPCYVEQIEMPDGKTIADIKNPTPLKIHYFDDEQHIIKIKNDNKEIKAFLSQNGIEVKTLKECKDALENYAFEKDKKIIYIL